MFRDPNKREDETIIRLINNMSSETVELFVADVKNELNRAFDLSTSFICDCFQPQRERRQGLGILSDMLKVRGNLYEKYDKLKRLGEGIMGFYIKLQANNLFREDAGVINQYVNSLRSIVYAAKHTKDINRDIVLTNESEDLLVKEILDYLRGFVQTQ